MKRKLIIYSPASDALKKVNKNGKESWERLEAYPVSPRIIKKEQDDPPEILEEGVQVLLEVWPGMTDAELLRAKRRLTYLLRDKQDHLDNYPAYLRGKKYWEKRYIGGQNLITLDEIPDNLKKLSWKNLADDISKTREEGVITEQAIKKDVGIFKDKLPQYLKDKVDLVAGIEKRASSR